MPPATESNAGDPLTHPTGEKEFKNGFALSFSVSSSRDDVSRLSLRPKCSTVCTRTASQSEPSRGSASANCGRLKHIRQHTARVSCSLTSSGANRAAGSVSMILKRALGTGDALTCAELLTGCNRTYQISRLQLKLHTNTRTIRTLKRNEVPNQGFRLLHSKPHSSVMA